MYNLDFINYSTFFSGKIKAWQVLSNKSNQIVNLDEYRSKIINQLSINIDNLAIPIQVHSNKVRFIDKSGFFKNTDGLITDNSNIILSLQTADCLPIFLFDISNNMKGLIHSGWKGTKDKIIKNALNIMIMNGSVLSNIIIVIGASIHKCCYEIGEELVPFFDAKCIYLIGERKYLSLQEQILIDLDKSGISKENIYIDDRCTFTDSNLSSYRRDKSNAGRMLSFLGSF